MSGTKASQWEGHMAEIMWRSVVKANVFPEFFRLLTTVYTLQAPPNLTYPTPLFDSWEGFGAVSQQDIVHPVVSDAGSTDSEVLQLEAASQVLGSNSESDQDDIHISHVPHPPANVGNPETERQPIKRKTVKKMELITELLHDSSLSSEGEVTIIAPRTSTPVTKIKKKKQVRKERTTHEHVCCPKGYEPTHAEGQKKRSETLKNPYSAENYEWGAEFSSDDDFKISKPNRKSKGKRHYPKHKS